MASLATTSLISAPTRPRFRSLRQALSTGPSSVSFIRFPHLPPVYSKAGSSSPQISCVVKQQIIEQVAGIVMKQLAPVIPADGQVISGVFPFSTLDADSLDTIPELKLEARNVTVDKNKGKLILLLPAVMCGLMPSLGLNLEAHASEGARVNMVYEVGELFELGIQLIYLVILLGLLGVGTFYVLRQVLVRRELDLSAKELQEQVRSGDASATEYFELGAVMLRRKFYPAAIKYLQQAVDKWDGDNQDLAQVYNALGVSYVRDNKLEKGIQQFESAVKVQPGYVTAWNNLGDAYEKKKDLTKALKAFEEVLLFDPNNKVARPRRDALKERVQMYKGIPVKSENQ